MSEGKGASEKRRALRPKVYPARLREAAGRALSSPAVRQALAWCGRAALGGVLAAIRLPVGCRPLGVAWVAACGPGWPGFAALLGAVGGYLSGRGLDAALRYAACCILVFSVSFAFYDLPVYKRRWFMPLSAAALTLLTGFATQRRQLSLHPAAILLPLTADFALTFLATHAGRTALALWRRRREGEGRSSPARRLENPAVIYDRAADRVCLRCAQREQCWQTQYQDTRNLLNSALPGLVEARTVTPALLPQRFRDRCTRLDAFVAAMDEALDAYLLRHAPTPRRGGGGRRYDPAAELPRAVAAAVTSPACTLSALAGVAGRKKAGEAVSGDACAWFKDDSGRLYLLLCDGMGSGQEARRESDLAIDLLERLLKAGFSPENALKALDQTFCLRLDEALGFSTVDLLVLDLCSGAGTLYKLGSAPSYLKQGGTVRALRGKGFPAGLTAGESARRDVFPVRLGPGDCLGLFTDGVFDEEDGDDRWLRAALMDFENGSPAALAEAVVNRGGAPADDKTALVLRITLRDPDAVSELSRKEAV